MFTGCLLKINTSADKLIFEISYEHGAYMIHTPRTVVCIEISHIYHIPGIRYTCYTKNRYHQIYSIDTMIFIISIIMRVYIYIVLFRSQMRVTRYVSCQVITCNIIRSMFTGCLLKIYTAADELIYEIYHTSTVHI